MARAESRNKRIDRETGHRSQVGVPESFDFMDFGVMPSCPKVVNPLNLGIDCEVACLVCGHLHERKPRFTYAVRVRDDAISERNGRTASGAFANGKPARSAMLDSEQIGARVAFRSDQNEIKLLAKIDRISKSRIDPYVCRPAGEPRFSGIFYSRRRGSGPVGLQPAMFDASDAARTGGRY